MRQIDSVLISTDPKCCAQPLESLLCLEGTACTYSASIGTLLNGSFGKISISRLRKCTRLVFRLNVQHTASTR